MSTNLQSPRRLNPIIAWLLLCRALLAGAILLLIWMLAVWIVPWLWRPAVPDARITARSPEERGNFKSLTASPAFVAVGGETGLMALDRETSLWREYHRGNTDSLPENDIDQVIIDPRNGRFLFRTHHGGLADAASNLGDWNTLCPISACPAPADSWQVATLIEPPNDPGDVWLALGTKGHGLCLYRVKSHRWLHYEVNNNKEGLPSADVFDLLFLTDQHKLVVAMANGVAEYRVRADKESPLVLQGEPRLSGRVVEQLDPTGRATSGHPVAARTKGGGVAFRMSEDTWTSFIGDQGILGGTAPKVTIARWDQPAGLLLAGTHDSGWDVYDAKGRQWLGTGANRGTHVYDMVWFQNYWWIGTNSGLFVLDPQTRQLLPAVMMNSAKRFATDGPRLFVLSVAGDLNVFSSPSEFQPLIDARACDSATGEVKDLHLFGGHLWMGLANGSVIVYDSLTHVLRKPAFELSKDEQPSSIINQLVRGGGNLWCLGADNKDQPGDLYRIDGTQPLSKWQRQQNVTQPLMRLQEFGNGVLAWAVDGSLIHIDDQLISTSYFDQTTPLDASSGPVAVAVDAAETLYVAEARAGNRHLCVYQPKRANWSAFALESDVKELTVHNNQLYAATHQGGLFSRSTTSLSEPSRTIIAEGRVESADANDPQIIGAAQLLSDEQTYVLFKSGNLYAHSKEGNWSQPSLGLPTNVGFHQLEAVGDCLVLCADDGSLVLRRPSSSSTRASASHLSVI